MPQHSQSVVQPAALLATQHTATVGFGSLQVGQHLLLEQNVFPDSNPPALMHWASSVQASPSPRLAGAHAPPTHLSPPTQQV